MGLTGLSGTCALAAQAAQNAAWETWLSMMCLMKTTASVFLQDVQIIRGQAFTNFTDSIFLHPFW